MESGITTGTEEVAVAEDETTGDMVVCTVCHLSNLCSIYFCRVSHDSKFESILESFFITVFGHDKAIFFSISMAKYEHIRKYFITYANLFHI